MTDTSTCRRSFRKTHGTGRLITVRSTAFRMFAAGFCTLLGGCAGEFEAYPLSYAKSKVVTDIAEPEKQETVVRALSELFGPSPREIKVPRGLGLRNGGAYLANYVMDTSGERKPLAVADAAGSKTQIAGGYQLYRKHCLHCHGVTGDGAGPTADFLYPRPRDYRKGVYKFTSTTAGAKPTRDDLWRTVNYGIHGTSMPGFEALMTPSEIQQVIDYVIFLSIRGETEILVAQDVADGAWDEEIAADKGQNFALIDWAKEPANSKIYPRALETATMVADKWKQAEEQTMNPPAPRIASTNDSILRGRELFLGKTTERLECWGCHGIKGVGDGKSFVDKKIFEKVMFSRAVFQSVHTDLDRQVAILQASAERFRELKDERESRLVAAGLGHGHHSGDHEPFQGWNAEVTMPNGSSVSADSIHPHDYPGLHVSVKTDASAAKPEVKVTAPSGTKPQVVEDAVTGIRHAVLSAVSGISDARGWVITYNGFVDAPTDAPEDQIKLARIRAELLGESIREQLVHDYPGATVNVLLHRDAPPTELAVVPLDEANSAAATIATALVEESVSQVKNFYSKIQTDWTASLDDWQWPLRPANINTGTYKGGRRPIDLYWRIAKGINGAKMPAHETTLKPNQIWDLVNFVLAVPSRPELLRDATEPVRDEVKPPQVAHR